jgi:hypothetical protein
VKKEPGGLKLDRSIAASNLYLNGYSYFTVSSLSSARI